MEVTSQESDLENQNGAPTNTGHYYIGFDNINKWHDFQRIHEFRSVPLLVTFVVEHLEKYVTDCEDTYEKFTQTAFCQSQGITEFKWKHGILQPFNSAGQQLLPLPVDMSETATNEAIKIAYDSVTCYDQYTQKVNLTSSLGSECSDRQTAENINPHHSMEARNLHFHQTDMQILDPESSEPPVSWNTGCFTSIHGRDRNNSEVSQRDQSGNEWNVVNDLESSEIEPTFGQLSMVTVVAKSWRYQNRNMYVGPINKGELKKLRARLGFLTGAELGDFVSKHLEEMTRDWDYMYNMIVQTGQLHALGVKALRWGKWKDWGIRGTDMAEAFRQVFDLLMGSNMGSNHQSPVMNLLPASGLASSGVQKTVTPENINADYLQQENSDSSPAETEIQLELGSSDVYESPITESAMSLIDLIDSVY